jgi:hypothetical protein
MKSTTSRWLIPLALLLLWIAIPADTNGGVPFQTAIVDQQGRPAAHVRLTTDNGIVCYTQPNGMVAWTESSLMNRDVHFSIESPDYHFPGGGTTLRVTRGGRSELRVLQGRVSLSGPDRLRKWSWTARQFVASFLH